jgi:uncharacterized membrane protein YidH (DUF202 family)
VERSTGLVLVVVGIGVVVLGLLVWSVALSWFGRLPGDIRHQGDTTRIFVPITSMIVVSVVATIVLNLLLRWWR